MMRLATPLLAALFVCSCRQSTPLSESERAEVRQQVRETLDNYQRDVKEHGLAAEFRYLDHSPEFFWVPPGFSTGLGYDSVAAILKMNAPLFRTIDNSWDTLRIHPITNEVATYTGRLRSSMIDTAGTTRIYLLTETGVMVKREDGWKLLCGQTSEINSKK